MGKKDKKKGKGAEKTAVKTEKKANLKLKKTMAAKGEEDIDSLIAKFVEDDRAKTAVTEEIVPPPSKRTSFTLTAHPDKDQLIFFGGEYFNGSQTLLYQDLFFYNIKQNRWLKITSPGGPAPRAAHQAVAVSPAMIKAFSISNKRGEILYISIFEPLVTKAIFNPFLTELSSSPHGDPPPAFTKNDQKFVYIFRDDLYWSCAMKNDTLTEQCGPLLMIESLSQLHQVCSTLCGALTQHSIIANATLIAEIIQETMNGGFVQLQTADKLQSCIYSSVVAPKETSALTAVPGLFGIEKSAPCTAAQQSALAVDSSKRELYVDVVEKVWASVGANGTVIRAEVNGSIIARCFFPGNPVLYLTLNTPLSSTFQEGFTTGMRMSEVEFGNGVEVSSGNNGRQLSVMTIPGQEIIIARYTLAPDHPHLLPFTLTSSVHALTPSDAELRLKLTSNTGMGTVSPQVTFRTVAPPSTAAVMSQTSGPREQVINFSPTDKTLSWTISQFPGGSYAQAFIRLVDAGGDIIIEAGELEFEVSRWVCSGIRVERVKLSPPVNNLNKWVRYLTSSDSVSIRLH